MIRLALFSLVASLLSTTNVLAYDESYGQSQPNCFYPNYPNGYGACVAPVIPEELTGNECSDPDAQQNAAGECVLVPEGPVGVDCPYGQAKDADGNCADVIPVISGADLEDYYENQDPY